MKDFFRSLFGFKDVTSTRTVVGTPTDLGLKEVAYIKSSNKRLSALQQLAKGYQGTPHAAKMQAVYEKTSNIHSYLVSKKKLHELKMFHLRHTDHFINTFSVILEVHQKHQQAVPAPTAVPKQPMPPPKPPVRRVEKGLHLPEMIKPINSQNQFYQGTAGKMQVPRLYVPDISINTFEKITFLHENTEGKLVAHQVGFTSSPAEKEVFLAHVTSRMGLEGLTYVGNAHLTIPNSNGVTPTGIVPIIHWEGFLYALNLNDYRLFPVRIYRKGS